MATLTIDLPDVPRPHAAYRLAADCPRCGASLVLRQNRQTGALFTGCSAYPSCAFSEPHDPRVQTLSTGVVRAVQALATQVAQIQAEAQRQAAAERATLAHELTVALVALRERLRPGPHVARPAEGTATAA
jgi:ssDNA-binding Zn-finger/Zn-ribbon topoisomerase 1